MSGIDAPDPSTGSDQRFRALADTAPVLIWMSGPDKEGIYFNQTWLDFTGKSLEEQAGDRWLELVHAEDSGRLGEICGNAFQDQRPFTAEFRMLRADGQYRWLLDCGTPRFDPQGEFLGFVGSCVDITNLKQSHHVEAELAAIVASSDDAIVSKTLDGVICSWNGGAERLFGYPASEAIGKSIIMIIPPELHEEEVTILARLRRGERIAHYETVRQTNDGRRIDVALTISPIRDASGRVVGASKVARDVTERKRTERELRESEERLRLALKAGRMGTWEWTIGSDRVVWSSGLEAIHGIEAGSFGGTFADFESDIHPDDLAKVKQAIMGAVETGEEHHVVYRIIRPDGRLRWVEGKGTISRNENGEALRMVGVCTDITERREFEQALRESEQRFSSFMQNLPGLAWIKDLHGRYVYVNNAAETAFQVPREQLYGKSDEEVFPETIAAAFGENDRQALASARGIQLVETLRHVDGVEHHSIVHKFPIFAANGKPTLVGGVAIDITERKVAEEALRESERRLSTLVANLPGMAYRCRNDADRTVEFVTSVAEEITGFTADDFALGNLSWSSIIHDDDKQLVWETIQYALRERRHFELEYRIHHCDGSLRWVWDHGMGIFNDSGELLALEGFVEDITSRKSAEEALRHSTQRYRAIVESQSEMVCRFRPDGEIQFANGAYARSLHSTPAELEGTNFWGYVTKADRPHVQAMLDRLSPEEPEVRIENRFESAGGTRWTLWTNRGMQFDSRGRATEVQSSGIDITDRKQAEAALRAKEAELQLVAETTPVILVRCSRELRYLFANRAAAELLGHSTHQIVGRKIVDVMGAEAFSIIKPRIEQVLRGERVEYEAEVPYSAKPRWVRAVYTPEFNEAGAVTSWLASIVDITERKRLEQSLRFLAEASKSLSALVEFKSTLENVARQAVPMFADWCTVDMLDAGGTLRRLAVTHVDPGKVRLAEEYYRRYPPDPNAPRGVAHVVRTGKAEIASEISDAMLQEVVAEPERLQILRELGLHSYMCVPLKSNRKTMGAITFVTAESQRCYTSDDLIMAEDLAHRAAIAIENARLYDELRDADRRKDEFLAMLAHELRNPLAPIRSGLEILAMDEPSNREAIGLMQDQVQHLVRLVDDLLDVSRIMQGKIELRKEQVELQSLVNRSVEATRELARARGHGLAVDMPERTIWLHADPVRIVQVIENLLTNALKYTDRGDSIRLSIRLESGEAVIAVRDTGIGIEPELLPKVFELFTQSSRSLDRAQGGLGIGLTLVRRLVELHQGSVSAHSEGAGRGSEFTVRLPAIEGGVKRASGELLGESGRGRRILVVDDNVGAARMLAILLSKLGDHAVEIAHDGLTALSMIKSTHPDLVLLDIGLPGIDGHEVARSIRELSEYDDVVLAALTGYGQERDRRKSKAAGFDRHLVKPVEIAQLKELLAEVAES